MSAWTVSGTHIDALLTAALAWSSGGLAISWERPLALEPDEDTRRLAHVDIDELGETLLRENRRSVAHLYKHDEPGHHPRYRFTRLPGTPDAVVVHKAIQCLEYQSCEHPGWKDSEAASFLVELKRISIEQIPGWAEAPWGIAHGASPFEPPPAPLPARAPALPPVVGPDLPAVYGNGTIGAGVEHGRRHISITLEGTASPLHRNQFTMAWITISEASWGGDLSLWALRRMGTDHERGQVTDSGRAAIRDEVLPAVAAYGFDRWWTELHRAQTQVDTDGAAQAHRAAAWWERQAALDQAHRAGRVELRPLTADQIPTSGARDRMVDTVESDGRTARVPAVAGAYIDGDQAGWLTDRSTLVPLAGPLP